MESEPKGDIAQVRQKGIFLPRNGIETSIQDLGLLHQIFQPFHTLGSWFESPMGKPFCAAFIIQKRL